MSGWYVTCGLDHELNKGSQVYGFCNFHGPRQRNRVKEAAEGEDIPPSKGYRDPKMQVPLPQKTATESYYAGAKRINRLHDLLNRHHRPYGG